MVKSLIVMVCLLLTPHNHSDCVKGQPVHVAHLARVVRKERVTIGNLSQCVQKVTFTFVSTFTLVDLYLLSLAELVSVANPVQRLQSILQPRAFHP